MPILLPPTVSFQPLRDILTLYQPNTRKQRLLGVESNKRRRNLFPLSHQLPSQRLLGGRSHYRRWEASNHSNQHSCRLLRLLLVGLLGPLNPRIHMLLQQLLRQSTLMLLNSPRRRRIHTLRLAAISLHNRCEVQECQLHLSMVVFSPVWCLLRYERLTSLLHFHPHQKLRTCQIGMISQTTSLRLLLRVGVPRM
jgi:hypothetical protein